MIILAELNVIVNRGNFWQLFNIKLSFDSEFPVTRLKQVLCVTWIIQVIRLFILSLTCLMLTIVVLSNKIPAVRARFLQFMQTYKMDGTNNLKMDLSFNMVIFYWTFNYNDIMVKEAELFKKAPVTTVVDPKTNSLVNLLSLQKQGRPLVISFGSCT